MSQIVFFGTVQTIKQRKEDALATIANAINELRMLENVIAFSDVQWTQKCEAELWKVIKRAQEEWNEATCEEIMRE